MLKHSIYFLSSSKQGSFILTTGSAIISQKKLEKYPTSQYFHRYSKTGGVARIRTGDFSNQRGPVQGECGFCKLTMGSIILTQYEFCLSWLLRNYVDNSISRLCLCLKLQPTVLSLKLRSSHIPCSWVGHPLSSSPSSLNSFGTLLILQTFFLQ